MNAGDQPVIGMTDTFREAGTYTIEVHLPTHSVLVGLTRVHYIM